MLSSINHQSNERTTNEINLYLCSHTTHTMNELIAAFTISPPTPCSHDFSKGRRRGEIVILISPPLLCAPFKHNLMISLFSIILYSSNTVGRSIDRTYYHYFMVKLCLSPHPHSLDPNPSLPPPSPCSSSSTLRGSLVAGLKSRRPRPLLSSIPLVWRRRQLGGVRHGGAVKGRGHTVH